MSDTKVTYRVRMRMKAASVVLVEGVDLETAYKVVLANGKGTTKHFAIDKVVYEPFSVLTAREANIRLEKGEY